VPAKTGRQFSPENCFEKTGFKEKKTGAVTIDAKEAQPAAARRQLRDRTAYSLKTQRAEAVVY